MVFSSHQVGFSLIELMVTIAVLVILASIAVPFFADEFARLERQKLTVDLESAIRSSRHQALNSHQRLVMCGSTNGVNCGDGNSWNKGWLLFLDLDNDRLRQLNEPIVQYRTLYLKYGNLSWRGFGIAGNILFNPTNGLMRGSNGTFSYCADNPDNSRKIILSYMGTTRVEHFNC